MKREDMKKGFALIFTVLVSSIVLLIAFGIFSVSTKESTLSAISQESYVSFFAADVGIECALFQDQVRNSFQTGEADGSSVRCANQNAEINETSNRFEFNLDIDLPDGRSSCSEVTLIRGVNNGDTTIESTGFNRSCDQDIALTEVQRSLRVTY